MKQISRLLSLAAVAALCFSACTEELNNDKINGGKTVTVHFGTENTDPSTKATLTPDKEETVFQAAWENGDKIAVKYTYVADNISEAVPGTWDASTSKFSAEIQDLTEGEKVLEMKYQASYPYSTDGYVDFGSVRTQTGAAYNSIYDLMVAEPVTVTAKPGLDESGNAIVFPMQRQTAIAYFHFTSDNTEAITKATLKVEGENAAIAAKTVLLDPTGMDYETGLSEIVLTTTDQTADNFTLWFNVLPTTYTKMTLIVETATKTFTISKNTTGEYIAGKLYKVKKGIAWTDKGGSSTPATNVSVINVDNVNAVKEMGNGSYGDYKDIVQTITVDGLEYSMINICANSKNSSTGYMMAAKQFIQMKSASSYILNTKSGVTNIKAWVLPKTTDAISVYQGSTSDNISTLINKPNKTTETVKLVSNSDSEVETQLDIYEYTITDGFFKLAPSATLWLYKLEVTYSNSGSSEPAPDTYSVSCSTVTGGTLSASPVKAEAGAEVTLTATPDEGYAFNDDWTVKDADEAKIDVTDGKFTMPAKDVTVSGSFRKVDYTITKATCEGGSFTVKKNGEEVTQAQVGDVITLEASATEGYEFDSWTVTNESTSKTVYVSENSFTMPGANVTVSANFLKVYASVADLIAAGTPTSEGANVTVTLSNEEITKFYTTKAGARRGVYFTVGTQEIELFGDIACPKEWVAGGWVSGTLTKCKWMLYNNTWELCPTDWTELTYAAPCATPVITLKGAEASITCATEGAKVRYTVDGNDPTETSDIYTNSVTLTEGQTIKAKAFLEGHKASDVASATYSSSVKPVSYTALFGSTYNSTSVTSYSSSWSATNDNFTVDLVNWNNNSNKWDYIKAGSKNAASVATITTKAAISEAITKVSITIDAVTANYINSITLYCGDKADACTTSLGTFTIAPGEQSVIISSPTSNKFYKISADCKQSVSNGTLTVSKVVYTNN